MDASRRAAAVLTGLGLSLLAACGGGGGGDAAVTPRTEAPAPAPSAPAPPTITSQLPAPATQPILSLGSDPGDFIGQGRSYTYDTTNASIVVVARGAFLEVRIGGRETWTGSFQLPAPLSALQPGIYPSLARHPFQAAGAGGLSWFGEGRGCNQSDSTLVIESVRYESGLLQSIELAFEQRCDGSSAALRGRLRLDAATLAAISAPRNPLPSQPVIRLTSDGTDPIGLGGTYAYDSATSALQVQAVQGLLTVRVSGDEDWFGEFLMPLGATQLAPGTYGELVHHRFQPAGSGAFNWSGEGRACIMLSAQVTIHAVRHDSAGTLSALDMSFEQRCAGASGSLRGRINWDASVPVPPPRPAATPPANLWQPPEGAMPATGNAMYLISDWNDHVGGGYEFRVRPGTAPVAPSPGVSGGATVTLTEAEGLLRLNVGGTVTWSAEFKAMDGLTRLEPGYYGIVQRYPFHNPRRGGLSFSMDSRSCSQLQGWFMVDHVSYVGDRLSSIDLRFAQHCEAGAPALRGRIRWSLDAPSQG